MYRLIYLETCLVFGGLIPPLVVLAAIQLLIDALGFEWLLVRAPSSRMSGEPLKLLRGPLKVHMCTIVVCQVVLNVLFWMDSELHGGWLIAAAGSLTAATFVLMSTHASGAECLWWSSNMSSGRGGSMSAPLRRPTISPREEEEGEDVAMTRPELSAVPPPGRSSRARSTAPESSLETPLL